MGLIVIISFFLKIVLVFYRVKLYLEGRFVIFFNYYEIYIRELVRWLIKVLENL